MSLARQRGNTPGKVLVVTGASGGHIFPATAFLEKIKADHGHIEVLVFLPRLLSSETAGSLSNFGYKITYLPISSVKLELTFKNLKAILNFLKGAFSAAFELARFKPDVVVSFGSLICVPVVFFAWIFRIKTILHEQNVIPGRANKFLSKIADKIAISFLESKDYLNVSADKLALTGNPLRSSLKNIEKRQALEFFGLSEKKFTILVAGGSQGSRKINFCFQRSILALPEKEKLQVIHLAGDKDYAALKEAYADFRDNVKLFGFFRDMQYAYSACDLAVTRAGATTVCEMIFYKLPAIIIPYPYAYQHQLANARVLEKCGSAIILDDKALNEYVLKDTLQYLLGESQRLRDMHLGYDRLSVPQTADRLVENALSLYQ